MDSLLHIFIGNSNFSGHPLAISCFPQQACVVELDANAKIVEIALTLPPAKAAMVRDPVEGQELNDAAIPSDQQVGTNARGWVFEMGDRALHLCACRKVHDDIFWIRISTTWFIAIQMRCDLLEPSSVFGS